MASGLIAVPNSPTLSSSTSINSASGQLSGSAVLSISTPVISASSLQAVSSSLDLFSAASPQANVSRAASALASSALVSTFVSSAPVSSSLSSAEASNRVPVSSGKDSSPTLSTPISTFVSSVLVSSPAITSSASGAETSITISSLKVSSSPATLAPASPRSALSSSSSVPASQSRVSRPSPGPGFPATAASTHPLVSSMPAESQIDHSAPVTPSSVPVRVPALPSVTGVQVSRTAHEGNADLTPPKSSSADKAPTDPDAQASGPSVSPSSAPGLPSTKVTSAVVLSGTGGAPSEPSSPPPQSAPPVHPSSRASPTSTPPIAPPRSSDTLSSAASVSFPFKPGTQPSGTAVSSRPSAPPPPSPPTHPHTSDGDTLSSVAPRPVTTRPQPVSPTWVPPSAEIENAGTVVVMTGGPALPTIPSHFVPTSLSAAHSLDDTKISRLNHLQANGRSSEPVSVSTVTDRPETTLSSPVFVSTTGSDGQLSLSVPPIFTSLAVSTQPNGQVVSVTHVIANPTGIWGVDDNVAASKKGFFANTGAVAGVFLIVGIVVAGIAATVAIILCRKRRRRILRHSISRPLPIPENPFEDPRTTPSPTDTTMMRYAGSDATHRGGVAMTQSAAGRHRLDHEVDDRNSNVPSVPSPTNMTYRPEVGYAYERSRRPTNSVVLTQRSPMETMGLAGIGSGARRSSIMTRSTHNGPSSDNHDWTPVGHVKSLSTGDPMAAAAANLRPLPGLPTLSPAMEVPSVESSPSIYPPSLPPASTRTPGADHGHGSDNEEDERPSSSESWSTLPPVPSVPIQQPSPTLVGARPRPKPPVIPPRSPLRHSAHSPGPGPAETKQQLLIQTQISAPQLSPVFKSGQKEYEPLTPPASLSSDSHSPSDKSSNPFVGYREVLKTQAPILRSFPSSTTTTTTGSSSVEESPQSANGRFKETFYTRRKLSEPRPAATVEWKNR